MRCIFNEISFYFQQSERESAKKQKMAFRRTFQLVIAIVLIGIFIGISPANGEDKVEGRASGLENFLQARQTPPRPSRIRQLLEFIRLRLSNNEGKWMFCGWFCLGCRAISAFFVWNMPSLLMCDSSKVKIPAKQ